MVFEQRNVTQFCTLGSNILLLDWHCSPDRPWRGALEMILSQLAQVRPEFVQMKTDLEFLIYEVQTTLSHVGSSRKLRKQFFVSSRSSQAAQRQFLLLLLLLQLLRSLPSYQRHFCAVTASGCCDLQVFSVPVKRSEFRRWVASRICLKIVLSVILKTTITVTVKFDESVRKISSLRSMLASYVQPR
jgi:hypothetical protein